ncbi:hypothetical protein GCM10009118_16200 [Wandonia haliotis]|uniref:Secreted protein n=1 Tax=Wandonia haliotis TaxID=574963 RepID=A0ABN1MPM5_9FLAO
MRAIVSNPMINLLFIENEIILLIILTYLYNATCPEESILPVNTRRVPTLFYKQVIGGPRSGYCAIPGFEIPNMR